MPRTKTERTRCKKETGPGAECSFITPGAGGANEPHARSSEVASDQLLGHFISYKMAPCLPLEDSPAALLILLPAQIFTHLVLPAVVQSGAPHLTWRKSFLPPCSRDEPHTSKNVHDTKLGNGAIISGKLGRVVVHLPVIFRRRGINEDLGNEIHYRSRLQ